MSGPTASHSSSDLGIPAAPEIPGATHIPRGFLESRSEGDARFVKKMSGRCIFKPFSTRQLLPLLAERVRARTIPPPPIPS